MALFAGFDRAYGTYKVETTKAEGSKLTGPRSTIKGEVNEQLWEGHLSGRKRIGIVPIKDDSTCRFGAIDIDVYEGLDYAAIAQSTKRANLPLVPCRSKSGGVHLYLFLREDVLAGDLQAKLKEWAAALGYGGVEVFPKQTKILAERGDIGNWINMPYFNTENCSTYGFGVDGAPLSVVDFLDYAEAMAVDKAYLNKAAPVLLTGDLRDGPPCLQHLAIHGCPSGTRNDGLFNFAVYCRKVDPQNWESLLKECNHKYMKPPLTDDEVQGVIKSASRKDYIYTCSKPPIKPHCNSGLCRTRKHGVGAMVGMPILSGLTKYDSKPPVWFVDIDGGGRIECATEDLQSQQRFQKRCMEAINTMPSAIKAPVWQAMMLNLLEKVVIIEVPDDASPQGQLLEHLEKFCNSKAQAKSREELLLGKPWTENRYTYFKLSDFIMYLERNHFRLFNSSQITTILQEKGGGHHFFNFDGRGVNVWFFPEFAKSKKTPPVPPLEDKENF